VNEDDEVAVFGASSNASWSGMAKAETAAVMRHAENASNGAAIRHERLRCQRDWGTKASKRLRDAEHETALPEAMVLNCQCLALQFHRAGRIFRAGLR
jgi:hypothetical protein